MAQLDSSLSGGRAVQGCYFQALPSRLETNLVIPDPQPGHDLHRVAGRASAPSARPSGPSTPAAFSFEFRGPSYAPQFSAAPFDNNRRLLTEDYTRLTSAVTKTHTQLNKRVNLCCSVGCVGHR